MAHRGIRAAAVVAAAISFLLAPSAAAQEGIKGVATGVGNRFINMSTPLANDQGVAEIVITHRFDEAVIDSGGSSLWGLDGSAQIGLGIEYVPLKNLAVQVYRGRNLADYEFAAKVTLLSPKKELPLAIGVRGGVNWLSASYLSSIGLEKQSSGFGQLLVSYTVGDRVTLAAAPSYVQRTPVQSDVWNVPVAVQIRITNTIALIGEFIPKSTLDLKGFDDRGALVDTPATYQWAVLLEKAVYHHRFGLYIGNTLASTVDQMMGGDYGASPYTDPQGNRHVVGGVTDKNIHFGFNITRSFDFPPR